MVRPGMQDGRFITNYSSNSELNREYFESNKSQNDLRFYVQSNADKIIANNLDQALHSAFVVQRIHFAKKIKLKKT